MKSIFFTFTFAVALVAADHHDHTADQKAVLAAIDSLGAAIQKGDAAAIGPLLADDLMYSHSNAMLESKAEAMKQFVEKKARLDYSPAPTVTVHGTTATVRGAATANSVVDGKPVALKLNILQVWSKMGGHWVLVARQATRLIPQ